MSYIVTTLTLSTVLLFGVPDKAKAEDCKLLGEGGCRGPNWAFEDWPKSVGVLKTYEECCRSCKEKNGCSGFHFTKEKECVLFGHDEIIPAKSLGGKCYKIIENIAEVEENLISSKECQEIVKEKCDKSKVEDSDGIELERAQSLQEDNSLVEIIELDLENFKLPPKIVHITPRNKIKYTKTENSFMCNRNFLGESSSESTSEESLEITNEIREGLEDTTDDHDLGQNLSLLIKTIDPINIRNYSERQDSKKSKETKKIDEKAETKELPKKVVKEEETKKVEKEKKKNKKTDPPKGNKPTKQNEAQSSTVKPNHKSEKSSFDVEAKESQGLKSKKEDKSSMKEDKKNGKAGKEIKEKVDRSLSSIKKIENKYILKVGEGGCRGQGWSIGEWPKLIKNVNAYECAKRCVKDKECTSIHIFDRLLLEGKTVLECLHFNHNNVVAVPRLEGTCFRFADTSLKDLNQDDSEKAIEFKKPVVFKKVGDGRCRGAEWQSSNNKWPKLRGSRTIQACSEECAKLKGCTSFDITGETPDQKGDCVIYAHKGVVSANYEPAVCYGLIDRLSDKVFIKDKDSHELDVDEEDDDEEELDEDANYFHMGHGRCRGYNWQKEKKWPKVRGQRSIQGCANSCQLAKGCTAFDVSDENEQDKTFICVLYGHKNPVPASSVPGECYVLENAEYEEDLENEVEEAEAHTFLLGNEVTRLETGACRGENWQTSSGTWPKVMGFIKPEDCKKKCQEAKGCLAFDLSPTEESDKKEKYNCFLFGHKDIMAASGVPGNCFVIKGALPLEDDDLEVGNYKSLGKGLCRGSNWQNKYWPKVGALVKNTEDCYEQCEDKKGCTGFDVSPSNIPSDLNCFLFGHGPIVPASALAGTCYKMKGRTPTERQYTNNYEANKVYKGACRGENWQNIKGWPKEKRAKRLTADDCTEMCEDFDNCKAFDIRSEDGESVCTFYSHEKITPASAVPGECHVLTLTKTTKESPHGLISLGIGACRGPNWSTKKWPKEIKNTRMKLTDCAEECFQEKGCTSFDVREEAEEIVCTIYGHKDIRSASAVPGECFAAPEASLQSKKSAIKRKTEKQSKTEEKPKEKKKNYKIPVFKEPKIIKAEESDDDEEWLFEPPPPEVRSREHIGEILGLSNAPSAQKDKLVLSSLKELKNIYESAVEPLESLFNYKELSNRHFGDPEIFGKPLVVLMGPWSGGKSTMINYILGTEFTKNAFRATAEPSAGFNFNIAMHGEYEQELEGTELAAEFAFSSLQKFGQEFLKKLRGKKIRNKLLEKAIFAEIPGVLETGTIRKVDRQYPFNDACQWFIDHADLILLVYDYAKLDIGPETEALLDQLKGRETQVRIILNKADEITAEELLKIQGNLVWNVSPLMASLEPPKMYAGSFWSRPYKEGAPKKLLKSQEISLFQDINEAITKRVENRIATARRFAVRVRNHAKMVDCYLNTYYNHKGILGDKKKITEDIIENPHKYHIYQGLSTMTNISRYDLPDPETYKDFFNLHPLYDFPTLKSTCTFFRGCPINKLDLSIAYELPELITKYKKENVKVSNTQNK